MIQDRGQLNGAMKYPPVLLDFDPPIDLPDLAVSVDIDPEDLADLAVELVLLLDLEVLGIDIEIDTEASDLLDLAVASLGQGNGQSSELGEVLLDLEAAVARGKALAKHVRRMKMMMFFIG